MPEIINGTYKAKFDDKTDPTWKKENQCIMFKRVCPECGTRFPSAASICPSCGAPRPRCQNRAMEGEETCRAHSHGRPYTIYNKLAGTLSDTVLEEIIEADDRDLSQEYALAKIALSCVLDSEEDKISSKDLMVMIKDFFTVAEKRKNIEKGQMLNISWNDDLVNSLRARMRKLIKTFESLLDEYTDEETKIKILTELKERTKMLGNSTTVPHKDSDYKEN